MGVNGNVVFSYGHLHNFAWFWFLPYNTPMRQLGRNSTLGCTKEFVCGANVFTLLTLALTSSKAIGTLLALHPPNIKLPLPRFLVGLSIRFKPWTFYRFFQVYIFYMLYLSTDGPSNMVFQHFQNYFFPEIQRMVSFNSMNYVPMSPLATSLGLWFRFLGLVDFWL